MGVQWEKVQQQRGLYAFLKNPEVMAKCIINQQEFQKNYKSNIRNLISPIFKSAYNDSIKKINKQQRQPNSELEMFELYLKSDKIHSNLQATLYLLLTMFLNHLEYHHQIPGYFFGNFPNLDLFSFYSYQIWIEGSTSGELIKQIQIIVKQAFGSKALDSLDQLNKNFCEKIIK
ncbi:hypothetical protein PPERSA_07781 [Pseudocohnilembus persalinus]|uniref:Uncharacterized protein n=1 Tax=Pseudocohnilembus persalinus TaxID=266149 RepID=A0A0V0QBW9_PSEPJ|nr:hypothetical protein PPERSA_07781 [Pseudocohnilembus persalinus]|eukprot:KRW99704.1 hypothetical protein PPERSA_07781 [Pseudocohnilembus persalinus]